MKTTSFVVEVGKMSPTAWFLGCNGALYTSHRNRERLENRLQIYIWHLTASLINTMRLSGIPQIKLYSQLRNETNRPDQLVTQSITVTIMVDAIPGGLRISVNGEYEEPPFNQLEAAVDRLVAGAMKNFLDEVFS